MDSLETQKIASEPELQHILMDNEQHIATLHQHSFILLKNYFFTLIGCSIFLVAIAIIINTATFLDPSLISNILMIAGILTILIFGFISYVITFAYRQTELVITNQSIVWAQQKGLLFHKVSKLSMKDVEDVSSEQKGILPRLLGYGTLTIETAGELPNFVFNYCKDPINISEIILKARSKFNDTGE